MSLIDRASNLANIVATITDNGNKEITGAVLRQVLTDLADSYANLLSDVSKLGLTEYDPSNTYNTGMVTVVGGTVYQANEDNITGAFTASKWTALLVQVAPDSLDFVPYDNSTTYNEDDRVLSQNKFFICDINGTIGILPIDSSPNWTEVSVSLQADTPAPDWIAGYYTNNNVVKRNNILYFLDVATPPSYNSTDIDAEIVAGDWKVFHNVGAGAPTGTANRIAWYDASGDLSQSEVLRFNVGANEWEFLYDLKNVRVRDGLGIKFGSVIKLRHNGLSSEMFFDMSDKNIRFNASTGPTFGEVISNTNIVVELRKFILENAGGFRAHLDGYLLTANRDHQLPDEDGELALKSDIPSGGLNLIHDDFTTSLILTGTPTIIPNASHTITAGQEGTIIVEWSGVMELDGDSTIDFAIDKNAIAQTTRRIQNNQGGGAGRTVMFSAHIKTVFNVAIGDVITVDANTFAGVGTVRSGGDFVILQKN